MLKTMTSLKRVDEMDNDFNDKDNSTVTKTDETRMQRSVRLTLPSSCGSLASQSQVRFR